MRVRYLLVVAACAFCLLALPQPPAPAEPQVTSAAAQIDFDALRGEAKGALEALQQSHEPRVASATSAAF